MLLPLPGAAGVPSGALPPEVVIEWATGERSAVSLVEVPLFAPGARVTASDASGPVAVPLEVRTYRGGPSGRADRRLLLLSGPWGVGGTAVSGDRIYRLERAEEADPGGRPAFRAIATSGAGETSPAIPLCGVGGEHDAVLDRAQRFDSRATAPGKAGQRLICDVAIDCDYDFYAQRAGGNLTAALAYVTDVVGTMSLIYERDLDVAIRISYLNVWTISSDPYSQPSASAQLNEFENWWNANRAGVARATAILVSGRVFTDAAGIAYVGTLCAISSSYAVCSFDGTSSFPTNATTRDLRVMAHELGHSFGSAHTHSCFWQTFGYAPAGTILDSCYTAEGTCYSGPTGIAPPDRGTIMSYCHLVGGVRLDFHPVCSGKMREVAEASCLPVDPVQPPRNVSASWGPVAVGLAWSPSPAPGVTGYEIYRSPFMLDLAPELRGTTAGTQFQDATHAGTYFYRVRALTGPGPSGFGAEVKSIEGKVDQPPAVTAPATATVTEGLPLSIDVTAGDPDGDALALLEADVTALPAGGDAAFSADASNTHGTLTWTPTFDDAGVYPVTFNASNTAAGSAAVMITVENDPTVAVSVSLEHAEAHPHVVRLEWRIAGGALTGNAGVERREPGTGWSPLDAEVVLDGDGVTVTDSTVVPGARYGYRLTVRNVLEPVTSGVVWINVPTEEAPGGAAWLEFGGAHPAPGRARLSYYLPREGPVRIAVFDARGRRVATLRDGWEGQGLRTLDWTPVDGAGRAAAGLYFARLTFGGSSVVRKIVLIP